MIRNGNVYVDKTMYLHRLVSKRKIVLVGVNYNPKTGSVELCCGPVISGGGPVNSKGGPVNRKSGPVKLLATIKAHPGLRKGDLSKLSGISERSVKRYIEQLAGQIEFRGAPKTGGYYLTTAI